MHFGAGGSLCQNYHEDIANTPAAHNPATHTIDSKEAVLDAAQRLINQYGYTGFSMRDLAQQSGLAKATLYHHFEDKREIFLQVLERDLTLVCERIAAAAATPGDLRTRLHNIAITFFELTSERGALLLSTLRQAAGMEQEFCNRMRTYRDQLYHPVVEVLVEAMASGTIRPVDPELVTMSFFGILQVFTSRNLLMADIELDEKAAEFILDFVLNGLLSAPLPTEPSNLS
jgi:AcrR family transcriptional regulator